MRKAAPNCMRNKHVVAVTLSPRDIQKLGIMCKRLQMNRSELVRFLILSTSFEEIGSKVEIFYGNNTMLHDVRPTLDPVRPDSTSEAAFEITKDVKERSIDSLRAVRAGNYDKPIQVPRPDSTGDTVANVPTHGLAPDGCPIQHRYPMMKGYVPLPK